MPKRLGVDRSLFFAAFLLAVAGLLMVGSASTLVALETADSPVSLMWRHGMHLALGAAGLLAAMRFDYRRLAEGRVVAWLLGGTIALLILVLAMPAAGGAHRWLFLGLLRFQPSELAKLVTIVFVAYTLTKKDGRVNDPWAVPIPCALVVGTLTLLVFIEPDLGSAVMIALLTSVMVFAAGLSWRYVGAGGILGALALGLAVLAEPYRLKRVIGYLNPSGDVLGLNFQLHQSLIALGNGGVLGTGFGQGQQKAHYLPAAHTDFIFSVVGEEIGLIGTTLLLATFLFIYWRGMRAALRAPDRFGFYLALGITHLIVLQALINMGVCLGLLPTKGLPLPFVSYGGSSLLLSMIAMGSLLNISRHSC